MGKKTKKSLLADSTRLYDVEDILQLETAEQQAQSFSDKIANAITGFSGSMLYVVLHILWFGGWIVINDGLFPPVKPFDPFPFSLLTMVVSLEAIFLSSFVLISQNKQAKIADKRAKIDLQINIISQQENSKMMQMINDIHDHLKLSQNKNRKTRQLEKKADIRQLAQELDKAEEKS